MTNQALNGIARFEPVKVLNSSFTLFKAYVMALGANRNRSYIGYEAAKNALPSLYNIPVVGHIYTGEDSELHMGGHDSVLKKKPGELPTFESICVPYGVVPMQDNAHFEDVEDPDGVTRKYLVADVILWTGRYPDLFEAKDTDEDSKVWFNQSMEINVYDFEPLESDKSYTDIKQYEYSALCLLGRSDDAHYNVEPCFHEARVETYSIDEQFSLAFSEMKKELSECFQQAENTEGDNVMPDETNTVEQTEPVVDPAPAEFTAEPEANSAEPTAQEGEQTQTAPDGKFSETKPETEPEQPSQRDAVMTAFNISYNHIFDKLSEAIQSEEIYGGDDSRWLGWIYRRVFDFTDDKVIYFERHYDAVEDKVAEKYLRRSYSIENETAPAVLADDAEVVVCKWLNQAEIDALDASQAELSDLRGFKANVEETARRQEVDDAISEFADMAGNEAYDAVYQNRYSYESIDALRDACYLIRGKFSCFAPAKPSAPKEEPVIPVGSTRDENRSLFAKLNDMYGNK